MKKIISSQKYSMYSLIFGKDFVKKQNERTNKTLIALLIVFVILNILGYKYYFFSIVAYIVATLTCVTLILTNNYLMTKFLSNSVKDYKSNFITWNFNYDSPILIKIWLKRAYNQFVKDEFKENI